MDTIYESFKKLLKTTSTDFFRYKYDEINWNSRMMGLVEPRGVGKTTIYQAEFEFGRYQMFQLIICILPIIL